MTTLKSDRQENVEPEHFEESTTNRKRQATIGKVFTEFRAKAITISAVDRPESWHIVSVTRDTRTSYFTQDIFTCKPVKIISDIEYQIDGNESIDDLRNKKW